MTRSLELRGYQKKIVEEALHHNVIIMMPTGSGKTFVAAELMRQDLIQFPHKKALFLVPTIDLVEQQANAIKTWMNDKEVEVATFHGGKTPPELSKIRVLVCTPQSFIMSLSVGSKMSRYSFSSFKICIFDEVHHLLKEHPYRKIAFHLDEFKSENSGNGPTVVGLSASLTYAVCDESIKAALSRLCQELRITKMCTPSIEQLEKGGFRPKNDNVTILDIEEKCEGILAEWERKSHACYETFKNRVQNRKATDLSLKIWDIIQLLEEHASRHFSSFESPLINKEVLSWETYAAKLKSTMSEPRLFQLLEEWYVALRLLVVSWEEEYSLVLKWLLYRDALSVQDFLSYDIQDKIKEIEALATDKGKFIKLSVLRRQLSEKMDFFQEPIRCIIFVRQRISVYVITEFINRDEKLNDLGLKAGYLVSTNSKTTPSIKVSTTDATDTLKKFRSGDIQILVATSVAEEVRVELCHMNIISLRLILMSSKTGS